MARVAAVLVAAAMSLAPSACAASAHRTQRATAGAAAAAAATNALGLDLQRHAGPGNVALSPWSAWSALTMPFAGAAGSTRAQMARVLHALPLGQGTGRAQRALAAKLRADARASGIRLDAANALWGDAATSFRRPYLDLLARDYGAPLQRSDFRGDPEGSRQRVNAWVADRTQGLIADLFPAGSTDSTTRLVLANALYFKAAWLLPFEPGATRLASFHAPHGDVQAQTMRATSSYGYARVGRLRALSLPYRGRRMSMVILLPDAGALPAVQRSLGAGALRRIGAALRSQRLDLSLPRFRVATQLSLERPLARLGMPRAFSARAQFPGISASERLGIQTVQHQVWIEAGEKGTEAAAATGVGVGVTSVPAPAPMRLAIDRPFLFVVRDDATGAALFTGRVEDPTQASG